jgi:peptide deformylase
MAVLEVRKFPDPILKKKTQPVSSIGEKELNLIRNMIDTMLALKGVGLAANQVGEDKQIFIASPTMQRGDVIVVINPKIIKAEGEIIEEEGCLSVPGLTKLVKRYAIVEIKAKDINEKDIIIRADGLLSRIFQHEIDHLSGRLFIDRLPLAERIKSYRELRKKCA